jgi:hypothetical protein
VLIPLRRVRCLHLGFVRQREECLAQCEHALDFGLGNTMVDQVGKTDVPARGVEPLADVFGGLD